MCVCVCVCACTNSLLVTYKTKESLIFEAICVLILLFDS